MRGLRPVSIFFSHLILNAATTTLTIKTTTIPSENLQFKPNTMVKSQTNKNQAKYNSAMKNSSIPTDAIQTYSALEERINIASHALGLLLSVIGFFLLVHHAFSNGELIHLISFAIFGMSLITLYGASTIYHSTQNPAIRARMRVVDHAAIYVLIAGTYTPMTLIALQGTISWLIFSASWAMAFTGIVVKLFFTGRFGILSTSMYVVMGWLIVFAIDPLTNNLSDNGLFWLLLGGIAYTAGALIYAVKKIPLNHAIFHIFVMLGSFSHFIAVYHYLLPL